MVVWEPGSNLIGDFTWPGFDTDIIITDRVGGALKAAGVTGFQLSQVEMVENSEELRLAPRASRVKLPYVGPQLWDLWVTAWAQLKHESSTIAVVQKQADGPEQYEVSGVEREEAIWDQQRMELVRRRYPRIEGQGLFVRAESGIFRVAEFPGWIFCTDEVKKVIEIHEFTNVSFLEMGDVLFSSASYRAAAVST